MRHCVLCGRPLRRLRWWQRGPLTPLPLCRRIHPGGAREDEQRPRP